MKKYAAEFIGTFFLVFAGTGAIVINEVSHGAITHAGIALTFGLIVLVMIYTLGDISGAHINPAVTIGFWVSRRLSGREVLPYIASQCGGALLASGVMHLLFSESRTLGTTQPAGSQLQSFVLEFFLTALLMSSLSAPGSLSMNPARSLGPALVSGQLANLWIYLGAPALGAASGVLGCRCVREAGCCSDQATA